LDSKCENPNRGLLRVSGGNTAILSHNKANMVIVN